MAGVAGLGWVGLDAWLTADCDNIRWRAKVILIWAIFCLPRRCYIVLPSIAIIASKGVFEVFARFIVLD